MTQRSGWSRKPPGFNPALVPAAPVEIDPGHPLANGIQNLYLLGADTLDYAQRGLNATPVGGPSFVGQPRGPAVSFNGSSQYLVTPAASYGFAAGTVVWSQKPATPYNANTIRGLWGSNGPALTAQVYSDNNWYVGWNFFNDQRVVLAASAANYPQGIWSSYAFVWSAAGSAFFQNGVQIGSNAAAPATTTATGQWLIAAYYNPNPTAALFAGSMSGMAVYNRVLSAAEIQLASAEPFAMVRPLARRRFYLAASAPASVATATGSSAATASGAAQSAAAAASAGQGVASAIGASVIAGGGTAIGAGAAQAIGATLSAATAAATGVGAAFGISVSGSAGIATAAGSGAATGTGSAQAAATATATGAGVVSGVGATAAAGAAATASGTATVFGVGASRAAALAVATGVGAARGVGAFVQMAVGSASGAARVAGVGLFIAPGAGVGTASGSAIVLAGGAFSVPVVIPKYLRALPPLPSSPLIDLATGNITDPWLSFMTALHARTGGNSGAVVAPASLGVGAGGPTWTTGASAPAGVAPVGSLYSRVGGAVGATLYISRGGGTWIPVVGV